MIIQDAIKIILPILVPVVGFSINQFNQMGVIATKIDTIGKVLEIEVSERKESTKTLNEIRDNVNLNTYRIDKLEKKGGP